MTCEEARNQMLDSLGSAPGEALAAHLSGCAACRAEWAEVQAGFTALPEGPRLRVPEATREAVRRAIVAKLAARPSRLIGAMPLDGVLAVVFGSAATVASLLLLQMRGLLDGIAPLALAAGAVAWAGLFILAFWTLLRRWDADPQLGHLLLGSLAAAGLFLVGNHFVPLPNVVQWCSSRLGARLGPLFFGLGALYAAVPLVLLSLRTSRWRPRPRRALLAGGFFFFLVAPAIFLQCAFFTVGALAAWLLGAIAGSVAGSAASYLFTSRTHPPA
jgi:hypothetical protein